MSDIAPSLAPRSAGAIADTELLRVAITDVGGPDADPPTSLAGRIRSFLVRFTRSDAEPPDDTTLFVLGSAASVD